MREEESKGNALPDITEGAPEGHSFEDLPTRLTDVGITRANALKLAGLGGAGFLLALVLPDEADARRRRKKRRRRRKAEVTPVVVVPGVPTLLTITNPGSTPLTISEFQVLDNDGKVIDTIDLATPITIDPGETEVVPVTINDSLVDADRLRLIDERGVPITVVDENGVNVGDIDIDVV